MCFSHTLSFLPSSPLSPSESGSWGVGTVAGHDENKEDKGHRAVAHTVHYLWTLFLPRSFEEHRDAAPAHAPALEACGSTC